MNNKTAILIFANSAEFEASQKPFQSSKPLFDALNKQTIKVVSKTGLPYFLCSEKNQTGSTFGTRFTNAIQSIYDKGFENVVTIGNDTPHLQTKHILKAVTQLQEQNVVLGPSKDGGFYLMGLKKAHFNPETFIKLPWQTSILSRSISNILRSKNIKLSFLEILSDIDTISDVNAIIDSFKSISTTLKKHLQGYISVEKEILTSQINAIDSFLLKLSFNKGSPLHLHL
ncbi:DUF2064 domain-containing protein [Psychroserpens damuponensis]|uniref:DUF2064 domain-containing protein n=1 Tax=Psychroserpens damuponensis TaxID=943936 RepID=UPI00058DF1DA|nr:DUF2064 domain-containing protein [Psychroserpens damuponensis]